MDDSFFSKIAKSVSEFMILAILKEKGETHTYEIQQTLLSKFSYQKSHAKEINEIINFIKGKKIDLQSQTLKEHFKINKYENNDHFEFLINELTKIISQEQSDEKITHLLTKLTDEMEIINNYVFFPIKIWESASAIYQVMKELDSRRFIEITRTETVHGRSRKIYRITEKGELEAIRMIFIFNGVYTSIYPQFLIFSEILGQFFKDHTANLNTLFFSLMRASSPDNTFPDSINSNTTTPHSFMNPFVDSQFQIIVQLLSQEIDENQITQMFSKINKQESIDVINNLKNYKQKIESVIKFLG